LHPFLTRKSEGRWVSGISETNFPIFVCKTGSRLRENFGGYWKIFRGLPSLKIWKRSDKKWGEIRGTILGFQISDYTCLILKGKENGHSKSSQPNQWDV